MNEKEQLLKKLNNMSPLIVIICFAIWCFYITINRNKDIKVLKDNHVIAQGQFKQIGRFEVGINTSTIITYRIEGQEYDFKMAKKIPCKNFDYNNKTSYSKIMTLKFPVAVSKTDYSIALPLLSQSNYDQIGKTVPDSMKRIKEKYFDCGWYEKYIWK